MLKVPRSQSTSIKTLIYPEKKKFGKNYQKQNIDTVKKIQVDNKQKKEEKENMVPVEPYKMKEFKNVESKLTRMLYSTNEDISKNYTTNREEKNRVNKTGTLSNQNIRRTMDKSKSSSLLNKDNIAIGSKNKMNSQKIQEKIKKDDGVKIFRAGKEVADEENIYAFDGLEDDIKEQFDDLKTFVKHQSKTIEKDYNQQLEQAKKRQIKGPTPKATEINALLPKIQRNHITDNKVKITHNEIPSKVIKKEEPESAIHKHFGKTPDYLKKYKQEAEEKKLMEKRLAEEAKYPKGTRLLSEDERVETLKSLTESRKEIVNLLEKMPITMKTMSMQNRKTELENKLNEIEDAIKTFSRKQVFIKLGS